MSFMSRLLVVLGLCATPDLLWSQSSLDPRRIEQCRQAVIACGLNDGAVVAVAYPEVGAPALVEPYFAHIACSGILAAEQIRPNPRNREFVSKWLKWYALRQKADGGIFVLDGKRGPNGLVDVKMKAPDSVDSYAGLYLYVAGRYAKVTNEKLDPDVVAACLRMLQVLEACRSPNELFWNFPPRAAPEGVVSAEYLLDNVEVYQGLSEIVTPLAIAGHRIEAEAAERMAVSLAGKLGDYWSQSDEYYVCLFGDRAAHVPFGKQSLRAEGLATTTALAFFDYAPRSRHEGLWIRFQTSHGQALTAGYRTMDYPLEEPTIERVYLAALRSAPKADCVAHLTILRRRTDELLNRFAQLRNTAARGNGAAFPYCHRFGLLLIALASPEGRATPYLVTIPFSGR